METVQGQCHCGGVQVSAPADAFGVIACHCEDSHPDWYELPTPP